MKLNLNVGIGTTRVLAYPWKFNCLNVDVDKTLNPKVQCDIQHLPFKNGTFKKTYCFHVLEHLQNPTQALKELIRVTTSLVEIEVPWRFGEWARGKEHVCSFRCTWFHRGLANYRYCMRLTWNFPFAIMIHVWIYPSLKTCLTDKFKS